MNQFIVLGIGIAAVWVVFMMTVGSKSTVWILKNRETLIGLSITTSVLVLLLYFLLLQIADLRSLYTNLYMIIPLNFVAFMLLRTFIGRKKAPEDRNLSDEKTKQYRVFDSIDLEERFKERQGELITWNMGGDKAYEIVNTNIDGIKEKIGGLRNVITDEIGFPIGIEITKEVKQNLTLMVESHSSFENIVGYKLNTEKSALSRIAIYTKLLEVLEGIYNLYPKVLGELDFDARIEKFGSVEMAFLDATNSLSMKKIPINIVQLYALVKQDVHQDVLGAIKNIVQERTVQKEGIYLYSLFLLKYAEVNDKALKAIIDDEVALAHKAGAKRDEILDEGENFE